MPLRYHLVYYAVFVLLLSVAYLVHPLFNLSSKTIWKKDVISSFFITNYT